MIHFIDPISTTLRWQPRIRRKLYSVPGPMSLWHIGKIMFVDQINFIMHVDGNHKLSRWRFIIHGGVDGFSRLVVYFRVLYK